VGAQAFAQGSDVYFGAGKSPGNNELTAHELTHVVQQTGVTVKRKLTQSTPDATSTLKPIAASAIPKLAPPVKPSDHDIAVEPFVDTFVKAFAQPTISRKPKS
jgi:hypothetical protein